MLVGHVWKRDEDRGTDGRVVDPGEVRLVYAPSDDESHPQASITLDAAQALMLAELLRKAAGWVLDEHADPADVERAAARLEPRGMSEL